MAADVALVARSPHPTCAASPELSSAVTPSTPIRDTDSCAPTMAQPMPSSTRCLARSRTEAETSSSAVSATQVASRPVGPLGVCGRTIGGFRCDRRAGSHLGISSPSWRTDGRRTLPKALSRLNIARLTVVESRQGSGLGGRRGSQRASRQHSTVVERDIAHIREQRVSREATRATTMRPAAPLTSPHWIGVLPAVTLISQSPRGAWERGLPPSRLVTFGLWTAACL